MPRLVTVPKPRLESFTLEVRGPSYAIDDDRLPVSFWVQGKLTGFAEKLDPQCSIQLWYESTPGMMSTGETEPFRSIASPIGLTRDFVIELCDFSDLSAGEDLADRERHYFAVLVCGAVREGETHKVIWPGTDVVPFLGAWSSNRVTPMP